MGKSSNSFHPGAPPIPTAAAFRVCHELSCTRRSAGSKERCCRGGHFCIFLLGGSLGLLVVTGDVVIKG